MGGHRRLEGSLDSLVTALSRNLPVTGRTRILDATAGDGARLLEVASWLADKPSYKQLERPRAAAVDSLYAASPTPDVVREALRGWCGTDADVQVDDGDPLAFFGEAVQGELFGATPTRRPPSTFGSAPFDAVLADVPNFDLTDDERERIRQRFDSATGRFTVEAPFLERIAALVAMGGLLVVRVRLAALRRDFGAVLGSQILARGELLSVEVNGDHVVLAIRRGEFATLSSHALLRALGAEDVARVLLRMERAPHRLADFRVGATGRTSTPGCDEIWEVDPSREDLPSQRMVRGDEVERWRLRRARSVAWPYAADGTRLENPDPRLTERLSAHRSHLEARKFFGRTLDELGVRWWEYVDHHPRRWAATPTIVVSSTARHLDAVLLRRPVVVCGSAIAIKPTDARSGAAILAAMNCSLGTLWAKQRFHVYETGQGQVFEATAAGLEELPVPALGEVVDEIVGRLVDLGRTFVDPHSVLESDSPDLGTRLSTIAERNAVTAEEIGFWQEELDWAMYAAHQLVEGYEPRDPQAGFQRAMDWLEEPDSPVLRARWRAIRDNPLVAAAEQEEFKAPRPVGERDVQQAVEQWLVDAVHDAFRGRQLPWDRPLSVAEIVAAIETPRFATVAELSRRDLDRVLADVSVPLDPIRVYSPSGLARWSRTVAGAAERFGPADFSARGTTVPPCAGGSFRRRIWKIRGKYDVRRESLFQLVELSELMGEALFAWAGADPESLERIRRLGEEEGGAAQLDLSEILAVKEMVDAHPDAGTAEIARRLLSQGIGYRQAELGMVALRDLSRRLGEA